MGRPPTVSSLSGRDFQAEEATYLSARGVWTVDRLPNGGDFQACEGARGASSCTGVFRADEEAGGRSDRFLDV